ncbi:MAG: hypothetical protein DYG89_43020 [Caldilinea sp. CFX5]|nr:hypothetical protein [Caldilinea sp. CFX5]
MQAVLFISRHEAQHVILLFVAQEPAAERNVKRNVDVGHKVDILSHRSPVTSPRLLDHNIPGSIDLFSRYRVLNRMTSTKLLQVSGHLRDLHPGIRNTTLSNPLQHIRVPAGNG